MVCRRRESRNLRDALHSLHKSNRPRSRKMLPCNERRARQCCFAYFSTPFTSLIEITGNSLKKMRKAVKNNPKLPNSKPISVIVGAYIAQLDGRKSRCKDVTMITNRSNHIPTLMRIDKTKMAGIQVRSFLIQKSWETRALHPDIIKYAHAYGPRLRLIITKISFGLPLCNPVKISVM